jgi:hypothetical protein
MTSQKSWMISLLFLFEAMKETHEQHKNKIDIDELITGPTSITLFAPEMR